MGFLKRGGEAYLVRNLMDSDYQPVGVLALALDLPYYFEDLSLLPWVSSVSVELGGDTVLPIKGDALSGTGDETLDVTVGNRDFILRGRAEVDYSVLLAGFGAYRYVLGAMVLSLLLLLWFTFRFFRRKISRPIDALMGGAADIQKGEWGRQIGCNAGSREFEYLAASFNDGGRCRWQNLRRPLLRLLGEYVCQHHGAGRLRHRSARPRLHMGSVPYRLPDHQG